MNQRIPGARRGSTVVPALVVTVTLAAIPSCSARETTAPGLAKSELVTLKGVPVLRLRGSPRERGRAHGRLLAPRILAVFVLYHPFLAPDETYEKRIRPEVRDRYEFPAGVADELSGMYEGMRAFFRERDGNEDALAAGLMKHLGRPFDELDLRCMQTIPDWYAFSGRADGAARTVQHCSAFVAWGALSPEGPIVGRNMDFGYHPVLAANHLLIFNERQGERSGGKRAWVSLAFPGIVGAITGVNEDGVCVFTLDSNAPLVDLDEACPPGEKMLPRMLALRRILEEAGPEDPGGGGLKLLAGTRTRWGQNIFIAGPDTAENPAAAGVIERTVAKTALRTADVDPVAAGVPAFACTNHFRLLVRPAPCSRYNTIVERMKDLHAAGRTLDEGEAFRLLWDVKQKYMTMQSVVLDLRRRSVALRLFAEPLFLTKPRVVRFEWEEIAGGGR